MNNIYIKIDKIYKKIKTAETNKHPIYISAPIGVGKTEAVRYYYRNKEALWLSGEEGSLSKMPQISEIKEPVFIIDDISWIRDGESKKYINRLIDSKSMQIVMMGRSKLPEWLKTACTKHLFVLSDLTDMQLNEEETAKLFAAFRITPGKEVISKISEDTMGHALPLIMIIYQMQTGEPYSEKIREAARIDTYHYYNQNLYDKWSPQLRDFLMAVSYFDEFDIELAEIVSGSEKAHALMNEGMAVGDFLTKHEDGTYEMRLRLRKYLLWKQAFDKDRYREQDIYARAAHYYEIHEQVDKTLLCYQKSGRIKELKRLLTQNVEKHVEVGH